MKKKQDYLIKVNNKDFKMLKKQKKTIILKLNDDENKNNHKIKIINNDTNKSFKKKIKKIYNYSNLKDFIDNTNKKKLGYKKKDNPNYEDLIKDFKEEDIKKYGLISIELKKKKHIFRKIILGIFLIVILFLSYHFVSNKLGEINIKKVNKNMAEVAKTRIDYVFVDINPSFVLTIKNNEVNDLACLNEDCLNIYNDLDIKGKSIEDGIDIIYSISKEKGFDTSNGVKIKSTRELNIKKQDYVTIEYIDAVSEQELLKQIKNNENIKNIDNQSYYEKLWNVLKEDNDYGKVYECEMNNNKLSCYMKKEAFVNYDVENLANTIKVYTQFNSTLIRIFNKFGINYELEELIPNLIFDLYLVVDFNGSKLKFNCDIDGECLANLVQSNGTYHNWGWGGSNESGELYSFYLYKTITSLDLLNPNDIVNGMTIEISDYVDYRDAILMNFLSPQKYPLIVTDDSYEIEYIDRQTCNLNNDQCHNYEYLETRYYCEEINDGKNCTTKNNEYYKKRIDKATYDLYDSYDIDLELGAQSLDNIGSTDYAVEVDFEGGKYYRCKDFELNNDSCTEITKEKYDLAIQARFHDGKYYVEDSKYIGNEYVENVCEIDVNKLKKVNCKTNHYNYQQIDESSVAFDFKYAD